MSRRNIVIVVTVILAVVIGFGFIKLYRNINNFKKLEAFKNYVEEYKIETSNYLITQHKDKYYELIGESGQLLIDKDIKNIEKYKNELTLLKEDIIKSNLELVNTNIAELESMDITNIEEKENIIREIQEIKDLKDKNKFNLCQERIDGLIKKIEKLEKQALITKLLKELENQIDREDFDSANEIISKLESENLSENQLVLLGDLKKRLIEQKEINSCLEEINQMLLINDLDNAKIKLVQLDKYKLNEKQSLIKKEYEIESKLFGVYTNMRISENGIVEYQCIYNLIKIDKGKFSLRANWQYLDKDKNNKTIIREHSIEDEFLYTYTDTEIESKAIVTQCSGLSFNKDKSEAKYEMTIIFKGDSLLLKKQNGKEETLIKDGPITPALGNKVSGW